MNGVHQWSNGRCLRCGAWDHDMNLSATCDTSDRDRLVAQLEQPMRGLSALALPAQAAADAAGMGDAERLAYHRAEMDRLDETGRGVKDYERRQAHMNCLEGLAQRIKGTERLEAGEARLRALADALEVQERRDGVNVAELHRLAVEASRTDSTSSAVRHARDELVRVCLSLGGES